MEAEGKGNSAGLNVAAPSGVSETSAAATAAMTKLLGTVPDCAWENVASFAAPSDCYNIALASKRFFQPVSISTAPPSRSDQKPRRKSKRLKSAGGGPPPLLLATRMLRVSLEHSLERVLEHSRSGITLESLKKLGELPEGSAVIAGSTMWLVEKSDCMFVGLGDTIYVCGVTSEDMVYAIDTNIHHVEHWGSISANESHLGYEESPPPDGNVKNTEYYKKVVGYGKQCQSSINWKFENTMHHPDLGIDRNKAYDVKPKSGGDLPYDFHGEGNIDLVVGRLKDKSGNKNITPGDLLSDFDLGKTPDNWLDNRYLDTHHSTRIQEICKCSFDGKKFHIADPHNTFSGKTKMEPNRRAVLSSYASHFSPPAERYINGIEASKHTSAVIDKVRADVRSTPFYRQLDLAASLPNRFGIDDDFVYHDPIARVKFSASIQFHNFVVKLIKRLKKYQSRGIEVLDAPAIADDKKFRTYDLTLHAMVVHVSPVDNRYDSGPGNLGTVKGAYGATASACPHNKPQDQPSLVLPIHVARVLLTLRTISKIMDNRPVATLPTLSPLRKPRNKVSWFPKRLSTKLSDWDRPHDPPASPAEVQTKGSTPNLPPRLCTWARCLFISGFDLEIHGADSIGVHSGTKIGDAAGGKGKFPSILFSIDLFRTMAPLAEKLLLIIAATCVSNGFVLRRRHPRAHGIGLHQRPSDLSDTGDATATATARSSRIQDVVADCGEKTSAAPDPDASARRRLLATTLTAGCGCCGSAIQAADALELSERESPYDKRRNSLVDKFFADGMATGMDDYESKAKPYKSQLFRNMFRTLSEQ
ncbi:hypothetical protein THAOC_04156, partial [Thalassiosira oceanica]